MMSPSRSGSSKGFLDYWNREAPRVAGALRVVEQFRGFDQVLGRKTSPVDASATDRALLCQDGGLSELLSSERGRKSGRARPQDHEVVAIHDQLPLLDPGRAARRSRIEASRSKAMPA